MLLRPTISTRTTTHLPYPTLFRSDQARTPAPHRDPGVRRPAPPRAGRRPGAAGPPDHAAHRPEVPVGDHAARALTARGAAGAGGGNSVLWPQIGKSTRLNSSH